MDSRSSSAGSIDMLKLARMNNQLLLASGSSDARTAAATAASTVVRPVGASGGKYATRAGYERYLKSKYAETTLRAKVPTWFVVLFVLAEAALGVGLVLVELYALLVAQTPLPTFYSGLWSGGFYLLLDVFTLVFAFRRTRKYTRFVLFLYSFAFLPGLVGAVLVAVRVLALQTLGSSAVAWMTYSITAAELAASLLTVLFLLALVCCLCRRDARSRSGPLETTVATVTTVSAANKPPQPALPLPPSSSLLPPIDAVSTARGSMAASFHDFNASVNSANKYTLSNHNQLKNQRSLHMINEQFAAAAAAAAAARQHNTEPTTTAASM